jgi:hypothetical protein
MTICATYLTKEVFMDTLAYLYLAEDYENSEAKELNLKGLKSVAVAGAIGAACVVGGVVGTADSASACGYYGCGGGDYYGYSGGYYGGGYGGGYYSQRPYYPRYYSYRNYYRPCY